jgi:leader peptidase (prepilin peptidase)/N-methyltransferase
MFWFTVACVSLLGLVLGSFLNVVIYRLPADESIVFPPSYCPTCQTPIRWYDNIPVLSWLMLDGECRDCGEPISLQYPTVEILTSALSVALWIKVVATGPPSESLFSLVSPASLSVFGLYAVFIYLLVVISFIDLEHMIVPHRLTAIGVAVGIATPVLLDLIVPAGGLQQFWPPTTFVESILGAVAGGMVIVFIFYGYLALRGIEGIGGGDVTLMAMIGAWLGWPAIIFVLFAASFQGLAVAGVASLVDSDFLVPSQLIDSPEERGEHQKEDPDGLAIPFGPFLALAAMEHFFVGEFLPPYFSMSYLYLF